MNRQQRRAAARRPPVSLGIRIGDLSVKEAEVVEEALDQYALELEKVTEPHAEQVWAIGRAKAIRDLLRAALENRPQYDEHGEREPAASLTEKGR